MLNTALPDVLQCLNTDGNDVSAAASTTAFNGGGGAGMSVVERHRPVLGWKQEQLPLQLPHQHHHHHHHHQQQQQCFFNENLSVSPHGHSFQGLLSVDGPGLNETLNRPVKQDPSISMYSRWPGFGSSSGAVAVDLERSLLRVNSATHTTQPMGGITESFEKRKPEKILPPKVDVEEDTGAKKSRACGEEQSKSTNQQQHTSNNNSTSNDNNENKNNRGSSACTSKEHSKVSEVQKPDYIHVRARRGQATDSHSLAERLRREKISERMKILQDLVPGCNKITGKAGMLDEIINYVQSLQRQVEFLSMKLAAVNPMLDFNIEDLFPKEVLPACSASHLPSIGVSPGPVNQYYLHLNPVQQTGLVHSSDVAHLADTNLQQSISTPSLPIPETFPDSSGFNQFHNSATWEDELQNIIAMPFPSQTYTGPVEATSLKTEM